MDARQRFEEWWKGPREVPQTKHAAWEAYAAGRLAGFAEAREDAAVMSPNGLNINGNDAPHTVWEKRTQAIRALEPK